MLGLQESTLKIHEFDNLVIVSKYKVVTRCIVATLWQCSYNLATVSKYKVVKKHCMPRL